MKTGEYHVISIAIDNRRQELEAALVGAKIVQHFYATELKRLPRQELAASIASSFDGRIEAIESMVAEISGELDAVENAIKSLPEYLEELGME